LTIDNCGQAGGKGGKGSHAIAFVNSEIREAGIAGFGRGSFRIPEKLTPVRRCDKVGSWLNASKMARESTRSQNADSFEP
jgi:hypothetical protein